MTGSGTLLDPYIIYDLTDLDNIRLDTTAVYQLGANIDATPTAGWDGGAGWTPIPTFTGQFNGMGFTINSLTVNRPSTDYVGIFANIGVGGIITKAYLTAVSITGSYWVGALAGALNYSAACSVSQSYSKGVVQGRVNVGGLIGAVLRTNSLYNSFSRASVTGVSLTQNINVGGLAGMCEIPPAEGIIDKGYSTGAVVGMGATDLHIGGLVGGTSSPA